MCAIEGNQQHFFGLDLYLEFPKSAKGQNWKLKESLESYLDDIQATNATIAKSLMLSRTNNKLFYSLLSTVSCNMVDELLCITYEVETLNLPPFGSFLQQYIWTKL